MENLNNDPVTNDTTNTEIAAEDTSMEDTSSTPETVQSEDAVPQNVDETAVAETGDSELEYVKDDLTGQEYIPRTAFEARIAKLTAQKHEAGEAAIKSFLENPDSNPEVKQQLMERLGIKAPDAPTGAENAAPQSDEWDGFLKGNVSPEYHSLYTGLGNAMFSRMLPEIEKMLEARVTPMISFIGKQQVNSFKTSHADFPRYERKIQEYVKTGRAKNLEDAYALASYEDKVKGAGAAAVRAEKERKAKLASNPSRRTPGVPGQSQYKPKNLRDAFEQTAKKLGM